MQAARSNGGLRDKAETGQAAWEDFLWALCMEPEM